MYIISKLHFSIRIVIENSVLRLPIIWNTAEEILSLLFVTGVKTDEKYDRIIPTFQFEETIQELKGT